MKIAYFGNKRRGTICLEALLDDGHAVECVVTPPSDDVADWYPSLAEFASSEGLPVYQPQDVNASSFYKKLAEYEPDLGIMAGYNQILRSEILDLPRNGMLNLHGGKLPEYRGASTLNWMIINGESEGGVTILFADEGIDTGDIVAKARFEIAQSDTIMDVIEKANAVFPDLLLGVLRDIEDGHVDRREQDKRSGSYYHSRRPRDGKIDWKHQTTLDIANLVRALAGPYPTAFTEVDGRRLAIHEVELLDERIAGVPGRVAVRREEGVVVIAADRGLLVKSVTPEGGDRQPANAYFDDIGMDLGR